jgi:zinc protease
MKILSLLSLAALLACAGHKQDVKPIAEKPQAPASVAPRPQAPPTAPATAAQATQGVTAAAAAPALMPDEQFRQKKPDPLPVQPHFDPPVPVEKKLKNGARVLIVENHQIPLVTVEVALLHGVDADPQGKPGLAEFVADTVDEGTKSRSATRLAEEIEDLAAHLGAGASLQTSSASLNCLTETLPKALDLLADVVQNPAFRNEDVERVRVIKLTQLEQKKASIGALAGDEANRVLFGPNHPWGQPSGGTPESVAAATPDDLATFHAAWWVPNNAVISVAGDVKPAEVVKLLEEKFAAWKARSLPKLVLPPLPALAERRIDALDKPTATQSQVWVVGRLFAARDPDAVPLRVANLTLGGLFGSRLNLNLREKHGYSYGVRSGLSLLRDTGTFIASGGIVAKNTVEAVVEYENELKRFAGGDVTDEELVVAKAAFIRGIPASLETNDAVAREMANLVSLGLPLDYYQHLPGRVDKLQTKDVARVARKWIKPDKWPVIIVGPVGPAKESLEKLGLGPVELKPAPGSGSAPSAEKK